LKTSTADLDRHLSSASNPIAAEQPSDLELRTIRRVGWRLIPFLMLCYLIAYLDRVNLSFASITMKPALQLTETAYGIGAGLFFLTYCLCEIPSNLLLFRFGATKWIARIMLTLGLFAGAMAFVDGQYSYYLVRLLLGAAEAGFYPGILFFLTLWFPSAYRSRILGIFIAAIPISGIIGAPLSGYLLSFDGVQGLQGWQWLYLLEAIPALLLAPLVGMVLKDSPAEAKWLPEDQRTWLIGRLALERTNVERESQGGVARSMVDPKVLFLAAIYFSNVCLLNGITFFLPQIISGFGFSTQTTGFIVAIPSLVGLVALIAWARHSDRRQERYGHAALANFIGGVALLLSVLLTEPAARIAAISVAFACTLAFTSPFWAIPGSFLTGRAAAGGIAVISALGVIGGFVTPIFVGRVRDVSGDFRIALGVIALLAMIFGAGLYLFGRRARAPGR
jgi:MFS family permease